MQATKAAVKKVKMATEKAQSTQIKKAATTQDNAKRTFTKKEEKTTSIKRVLNEMPDKETTTQGDEDHTII